MWLRRAVLLPSEIEAFCSHLPSSCSPSRPCRRRTRCPRRHVRRRHVRRQRPWRPPPTSTRLPCWAISTLTRATLTTRSLACQKQSGTGFGQLAPNPNPNPNPNGQPQQINSSVCAGAVAGHGDTGLVFDTGSSGVITSRRSSRRRTRPSSWSRSATSASPRTALARDRSSQAPPSASSWRHAMWKPGSTRPASIDAAQPAHWPRLLEAPGSLDHGLALSGGQLAEV